MLRFGLLFLVLSGALVLGQFVSQCPYYIHNYSPCTSNFVGCTDCGCFGSVACCADIGSTLDGCSCASINCSALAIDCCVAATPQPTPVPTPSRTVVSHATTTQSESRSRVHDTTFSLTITGQLTPTLSTTQSQRTTQSESCSRMQDATPSLTTTASHTGQKTQTQPTPTLSEIQTATTTAEVHSPPPTLPDLVTAAALTGAVAGAVASAWAPSLGAQVANGQALLSVLSCTSSDAAAANFIPFPQSLVPGVGLGSAPVQYYRAAATAAVVAIPVACVVLMGGGWVMVRGREFTKPETTMSGAAAAVFFPGTLMCFVSFNVVGLVGAPTALLSLASTSVLLAFVSDVAVSLTSYAVFLGLMIWSAWMVHRVVVPTCRRMDRSDLVRAPRSQQWNDATNSECVNEAAAVALLNPWVDDLIGTAATPSSADVEPSNASGMVVAFEPDFDPFPTRFANHLSRPTIAVLRYLFFGLGRWVDADPNAAVPTDLPPTGKRLRLLFGVYRVADTDRLRPLALRPVAAFHMSVFVAAVTSMLSHLEDVDCSARAWLLFVLQVGFAAVITFVRPYVVPSSNVLSSLIALATAVGFATAAVGQTAAAGTVSVVVSALCVVLAVKSIVAFGLIMLQRFSLQQNVTNVDLELNDGVDDLELVLIAPLLVPQRSSSPDATPGAAALL